MTRITPKILIISLIINSFAYAESERPSSWQGFSHYARKISDSIHAHPYFAAGIAAGTAAACYIFWTQWRRNYQDLPALFIVGLGAHLNAGNNVHPGRAANVGAHDHAAPGAGIHEIHPESMYQEALMRSAQEHARLENLQMRPADHRFQQDVLGEIRVLPTTEERVLALQALLYNYDQVFVRRGALLEFVNQMVGIPLEHVIDQFARITQSGWSLLCLTPKVRVLDLDAFPQMRDFHDLLKLIKTIRQIAHTHEGITAQNAIDSFLAALSLHEFDEHLLRLLRGYFLFSELSSNEDLRLELLFTELLGDDFARLERPVELRGKLEKEKEEADKDNSSGQSLRPVTEKELKEREEESEQGRLARIRKAREDFYKKKNE